MADRSAAGKFLRVLGWLLLAALIIWILASVLGLINRPSLPRLFGVGTQHAGEYTFSPAAQQRLEEAQARMDAANRRYNTLRWLGDLATWASFLSTAAITLITGGFNLPAPRPPGSDETDTSSAENLRLRPKRFHTLGFLAAVASVCTLLGAQLGEKASATLACSKEIRDQITEVAQAIKDNPQGEIVLLTRLRDATGRSCL